MSPSPMGSERGLCSTGNRLDLVCAVTADVADAPGRRRDDLTTVAADKRLDDATHHAAGNEVLALATTFTAKRQ
jgi:hypothetical protein